MQNKHTILVVDDEIDSLRFIVDVLTNNEFEYTIFQANNADEAMKIACHKFPDVIITDWNMPDKSGIELISELKSIDSTKDIPVLITTAYMITSYNLKMALEAGAIDYIRKPFDTIELEARLNAAILLSQSRKEALLLKDKEIQDKVMYITKRNQFIANLGKELHKLNYNDKNSQLLLNQINNQIEDFSRSDMWDKFDTSFGIVKASFNKNILSKFPNLSPKDLKIAYLIAVGMSTKDMSSILCQTIDSIKVARYRVRKKMNLNSTDNLQTFLTQL